jgi:hypothetical protein
MRKAALLVALLFALPALAERRPELRKNATLVVVGTVEKLTSEGKKFGGDGVMTTYKAKVKVSKVEKGDVKVGDVIDVTWFHVTKRPSRPLAGAYGQNHGLKEKDAATFWLLGGEKGKWEIIYNKDGVEKVKK